jgi:integrase
MPRPPSDRPYICGPYKHRQQFRLVIYNAPGGRGRRKKVHRYFESEERAKAWKREYRRQVVAHGRTVGDAVAEYIDYLRVKRGNKETSVTTSRYRLARYLDFDMPLVDLNARRAMDLYEEMLEEGYARGMQGKRYAPDSHHDSVMEAKAFAKFCMRRSYLSSNPFEKVEVEGKKRRRKKQLRVDEARTFARHCLKEWTKNRDRSAIAALLPLQFNLRATEVSQLIARDVDDQGRLLWIAYNEDQETGDELAKTDAAKRTVSVPPHLVPVLRYLAEHPATEQGHLFAKEDGTPADRHWVRYWVLEHSKAAGTPPVTTHGLRGTWASLKRAGAAHEHDREQRPMSEEEIADEMGHADRGETAARHYIDPVVAAEAQNSQVAETIFDGVPVPVEAEATPKIARPPTTPTAPEES